MCSLCANKFPISTSIYPYIHTDSLRGEQRSPALFNSEKFILKLNKGTKKTFFSINSVHTRLLLLWPTLKWHFSALENVGYVYPLTFVVPVNLNCYNFRHQIFRTFCLGGLVTEFQDENQVEWLSMDHRESNIPHLCIFFKQLYFNITSICNIFTNFEYTITIERFITNLLLLRAVVAIFYTHNL